MECTWIFGRVPCQRTCQLKSPDCKREETHDMARSWSKLEHSKISGMVHEEHDRTQMVTPRGQWPQGSLQRPVQLRHGNGIFHLQIFAAAKQTAAHPLLKMKLQKKNALSINPKRCPQMDLAYPTSYFLRFIGRSSKSQGLQACLKPLRGGCLRLRGIRKLVVPS